jgi:hypothetical protein
MLALGHDPLEEKPFHLRHLWFLRLVVLFFAASARMLLPFSRLSLLSVSVVFRLSLSVYLSSLFAPSFSTRP